MERALVVFESMFGNTRMIADAVAEGLASRFETSIVEVGDAPVSLADDVSLLVVGGPTHAFGLSRPGTRQDASRQAEGEIVSRGKGLREWLSTLKGRRGIGAASFDTRIDRPRVRGSAARAAERRLRRLGFRVVVPAQSFWVTGTKGPLVPSEVERACRWAERIAVESHEFAAAT
jgi:Flavodoxin